MSTELKTFYPKDRKTWRQWLQKHHAKEPGVWLIYYKKNTGKSSVSYDESVEEALCFGWIDSTMRPIDEEKYMQRFSPRKPSSVWSALNKRRIEKLQEQGLLAPAGIAAVERAKKNGSWSSLDQIESLVIPDDFQKALDRNKKALKNFQEFSPSI